MKAYQSNGFEYFFDKNIRQWILYPIDDNGNRIEHDIFDEPIESKYFNNKTEITNFLSLCIKSN